jgi:hypothetical protein
VPSEQTFRAGPPPAFPPPFPADAASSGASPSGRRRWALVAAVVVALLLAGGLTAFLLLTGGPAQATGLNAVPTDGGVTLTWKPVADADHYELSRDGQHLAQTTDPTYLDARAVGGTHYQYSIVTADRSGNRSDAATFPSVTAALARPHLAAPVVNGLSVMLSWDPVPGAGHYEVTRDGTTIAADLRNTTYTDQTVVGQHTYGVTAVDDHGGAATSTTTVPVTVAPWGTMQPIASAFPALVPATPADHLDTPAPSHSCRLRQPPVDNSAEQIVCTFSDNLTVFIDRWATPQAVANDFEGYRTAAATTWNCNGAATLGQRTEGRTAAATNLPYQLINFLDPKIALYDIYAQWTVDKSVDDVLVALGRQVCP